MFATALFDKILQETNLQIILGIIKRNNIKDCDIPVEVKKHINKICVINEGNIERIRLEDPRKKAHN